jgi:hypothetical protein
LSVCIYTQLHLKALNHRDDTRDKGLWSDAVVPLAMESMYRSPSADNGSAFTATHKAVMNADLRMAYINHQGAKRTAATERVFGTMAQDLLPRPTGRPRFQCQEKGLIKAEPRRTAEDCRR